MKNIKFFYPNGNLLHPTTGGEIYDNNLYNQLKIDKDLKIEVIHGNGSKFKTLKNFFKTLKESSKDEVIFINSRICTRILPVLFYNKVFGKKKIYIIHHHFAYQENKGLKMIILKFIEECTLRLSNKIVSPNPYVVDCIKKVCPEKKICFIGHPFEHKLKNSSKYEHYKLLFVGTIYYRKGIDLLLESLNKLPILIKSKLSLNLVGNIIDDEYFKLLKDKIIKFDLEKQVKFIGRVSAARLNELYRESYCFILPSRHEGYGLVIEEAMSYGLPVIAFDNSAMPYTIKSDYNGILVKDGDVASLSSAIEKIVTDGNLHKTLCNGALESYSKSHDILDFQEEVGLLIHSMKN